MKIADRRKAAETFNSAVRKALIEHGATEHTVRPGWFIVQTPLGSLNVSPSANDEASNRNNPVDYTVFASFVDMKPVQAYIRTTSPYGGTLCGMNVNGHSGKWNFHAFSAASDAQAEFESWYQSFERLLRLPV